jgi:CubicO group peptidase (beta-lactamase class C family)
MTTRTGLKEQLDELARAGRVPGLHGVVAVQDGGVAVEWYGTGEDHQWGQPLGRVVFGPDVLHDVRSVTKSVVGLLYGIALADGLVPGPAEPLMPQFPEYPDLAADPARAGLTVEHALTMTLGLEWDESAPYTSPDNSEIAMEMAADRHRYVLERPVAEPPGQHWSYCAGASAILARLIAKGTGQTLPDYARQVLFDPLGIAAFDWSTGPDGVASAASGLRLTPSSMAKIGQLALGHGQWQGHQIVPDAWLADALRRHVLVDADMSYGYQWWVGTVPAPDPDGDPIPWVAARGNGGHRIYVMPSLDLTVAIVCGDYDAPDQRVTPTTVMTKAILPTLRH